MELLQEQRDLIEKLVKASPKYSGNEDLLEDFCSETYKKSYLILQTVKNVDSLEAYMKKVVSSAIIDVLRNSGRVVRSSKGYTSVKEIPIIEAASDSVEEEIQESMPETVNEEEAYIDFGVVEQKEENSYDVPIEQQEEQQPYLPEDVGEIQNEDPIQEYVGSEDQNFVYESEENQNYSCEYEEAETGGFVEYKTQQYEEESQNIVEEQAVVKEEKEETVEKNSYSVTLPELDRLRKEAPIDTVTYVMTDDLAEIKDPRESIEEQVIRKDIIENIINLVKQIDADLPQEMYLKIFYRRYFLQLKQREISQELNISQAEVSKRLVKLSRLIKEKLY